MGSERKNHNSLIKILMSSYFGCVQIDSLNIIIEVEQVDTCVLPGKSHAICQLYDSLSVNLWTLKLEDKNVN